jgi:hypothetical protein
VYKINTQMKENQIFVKKIEIFYKKKPSLSIAQVQITDKNLHPFVYSTYYSRGRKRERENSTKLGASVLELQRGCAGAGAWACYEREIEVKRERVCECRDGEKS